MIFKYVKLDRPIRHFSPQPFQTCDLPLQCRISNIHHYNSSPASSIIILRYRSSLLLSFRSNFFTNFSSIRFIRSKYLSGVSSRKNLFVSGLTLLVSLYVILGLHRIVDVVPSDVHEVFRLLGCGVGLIGFVFRFVVDGILLQSLCRMMMMWRQQMIFDH